ncbi:27016_t:CDS:2, partial [Gigaspora margarita]
MKKNKIKETEKVDIYATNFKKLISRVNVNHGFLNGYIVKIFLNRLKGNNATFVAIATSKNLNKAIVAARRVEASLALNYANLTAKLKETINNQPNENIYRRYNQNNYKWKKKKEIEYRKCREMGHIARN